MNRLQLEHLVRAASDVTGIADLLVVGSQAILGSFPDRQLPAAAIASVEADIAVDRELARVEFAVDETALADAIDGTLGEGSQFHRTYGYYAKGVEVISATLTTGWRGRLVRPRCETSRGHIVGWCLSAPDAWVAKAAAGRPKDFEFCGALARAGLVDKQACAERIEFLAGVDRARAEIVLARSW